MATERSTISDSLASQKTAAIARPKFAGAADQYKSSHSKPTEILNRGDLGVPHQKAISEFVTKASDSVRRRKRIVEVTFFAICLVSTVTFIFAAWYTDGRIVSDSIIYLRKFEPQATQSRNRGENCKDPKNANTPYCKGAGRPSSSGGMNWRSVGGAGGKGKPVPFTLHGH